MTVAAIPPDGVATHASRKLQPGRGTVATFPVAGARDRIMNALDAMPP